jgi:Tfp pilus assembly pilus retraction ATPase PilT
VPRIDSILQLVQAQGASDLHLVSGSPPMLRLLGDLQPIEFQPLTSEVIVGLLAEIMNEEQMMRYQALDEVDFAYEVPGVVRLRCNVYQQANGMAAAFRLLPTRISPTKITFGSSRNAARRAAANERVLRPTSRWFMRHDWFWCTYSIGSSSVITCLCFVRLM